MILNPPPWPGGASCAVAITFDMDADSLLHLAHHEDATNRAATMSLLQYGPQIAMPRILKLYRERGLRQTFFIPSWCLERYPAVVEAVLRDGHEIGQHGYLHEHPNELTLEQEQYWFQRALAAFEARVGARPAGYRAPSYRFSRHTHELLLGAGFAYDASLMGDDVPYLIGDGTADMVELPSHYALDDWAHFMLNRDLAYTMPIKSPEAAMEVYRAEFDSAWRHGGLWIAVWHPFLSGRPSRMDAIAGLIDHMQARGGVWFATLGEIAAHTRALAAAGIWRPRSEVLPAYPAPIPEMLEGPFTPP